MADGVDITAGSGTTVLTDDTGATGHAQVVKLAISTDGSPTLLPGDTDGLLTKVGTREYTEAFTGTGNGTTREVRGATVATIMVTGTFVGTVDLRGSHDGTNWEQLNIMVGGQDHVFTLGAADVNIAHFSYGIERFQYIRAQCTGYTSGQIDVRYALIPNSNVAVGWVQSTYDTTGWHGEGEFAPIRLGESGEVAVAAVIGGGSTGDGILNALSGAFQSTEASEVLHPMVRPYVYNGTTWDRQRGDSTNGLLVNLGSNNDVTVTGTVTANLAAGTNNVGDVDVASIAAGDNNIGNVDIVTVPAPLSTTGGGTEATALRVTVASDSTGVLSVDDNNSTLSVDDGGSTLSVDGTVGLTAGTGAPLPSSHGATLITKTAQYTTQQTGAALWTPSAGNKVVVFYVQIQATGTTGGSVQLWFGASGDTTYSRGTDAAIFDGSFIPSATSYPGVVIQPPVPFVGTDDYVLRVTDSAAINSLTVTVWGYEIA